MERKVGYQHTNSKGVTYYLNCKVVALRGSRKMPVYYFTKDVRPEACDLPHDFTVLENPRNGFLTVRVPGHRHLLGVLHKDEIKAALDKVSEQYKAGEFDMAERLKMVHNGDAPAALLTRNYGIRQQYLFLSGRHG